MADNTELRLLGLLAYRDYLLRRVLPLRWDEKHQLTIRWCERCASLVIEAWQAVG